MKTIVLFLVKMIFKFLFRCKAIGYEKLKFDGATMILPNHVSFLDSFYLAAFLPLNTVFVINTMIAKKHRFFLHFVNYITVDPLNPYALKKLIAAIKQGKPVVIFPEGRITVTGNLMKIYSGIGLVAYKTRAKIYPVILLGPEYTIFSKVSDKVHTQWNPSVTVYFDDQLELDLPKDKSFKQLKPLLSDKIFKALMDAKFKAKQEKDVTENLFDKLVLESKVHGVHRVIAKDISGEITYKKIILNSHVLGGKLESLFKEQETVGILLPNSLAHLVTLFACFKAAKAPAILNFTAGVSNNIDCATAANVKTILTAKTFIEKAKLQDFIAKLSEKFNIIYLEDVKQALSLSDKLLGFVQNLMGQKAKQGNNRLILFTSGSENKPKGVVLRHANLIANANQLSVIMDTTHQDKVLNALPMFHSFGLSCGTFYPLFNGIEVFLYPSPLHYKIIPELAYEHNTTMLIGTPTFLMGYAKNAHPFDFFSLRYAFAGGEKLKEEVKNAWVNKFGIRIIEGYGTTETAPVLTANTPMAYKYASVGRFLPGIQYKIEAVEGIDDGGKLYVKGPNVMEGYYIFDKGFVPQGEWYDTGDVVTVDPDGFVTIKSRLKRFAKISGEMVSLDRVEKLAEACFKSIGHGVVSVSDAKKGEKLILFTSDSNVNKKSLREYINQTGNSMLMMPAQIIIIEKLPLLGSGKTDYVKLSAMAREIVKTDD